MQGTFFFQWVLVEDKFIWLFILIDSVRQRYETNKESYEDDSPKYIENARIINYIENTCANDRSSEESHTNTSLTMPNIEFSFFWKFNCDD